MFSIPSLLHFHTLIAVLSLVVFVSGKFAGARKYHLNPNACLGRGFTPEARSENVCYGKAVDSFFLEVESGLENRATRP